MFGVHDGRSGFFGEAFDARELGPEAFDLAEASLVIAAQRGEAGLEALPLGAARGPFDLETDALVLGEAFRFLALVLGALGGLSTFTLGALGGFSTFTLGALGGLLALELGALGGML